VTSVRALSGGLGRLIDAAMARGPLRKTWADALAHNRSRDLSRATELREQRRYGESARIVKRVLAVDPDNPRADWLRRELRVAPEIDHAEELWREARRDEAVELLRDLARRVPDEPEVHLRLAPMFVVQDDYGRAAEHALRAVDLAPDDPNVLFRAASQARWGDSSASRDYLERAKEIIAGDGGAIVFPFDDDLPHLEGLLAFDEGRPDIGLDYLERAFALQPDAVSVAGDLAQGYLEHGRADDALDVIRKGLQERPGDERLLRIYNDIESGRGM
jgi:tetratricopeptide (TPR) repeat protein